MIVAVKIRAARRLLETGEAAAVHDGKRSPWLCPARYRERLRAAADFRPVAAAGLRPERL